MPLNFTAYHMRFLLGKVSVPFDYWPFPTGSESLDLAPIGFAIKF